MVIEFFMRGESYHESIIFSVISLHYSFTDNGKVLKTVNAESADSIQRVTPVVIEEIQVFPSNVSVRNIQIVRTDTLSEGRLVVISDLEVVSLKLHRCDKVNSGCRLVFYLYFLFICIIFYIGEMKINILRVFKVGNDKNQGPHRTAEKKSCFF